jgi:exodeoxyribonuclease VIII
MISNSDLTLINKSIDHFLLKAERDSSDAQELGQAFHDMILTPDIFESKYIKIPEEIKIRKGKEWDIFNTENKDKKIISKEDWRKLLLMQSSFINHPKAYLLLNDGKAEQTYCYEVDDVKCKCRPDFVNTKYGCLIDIKTTASALLDDFSRSMASYRYHVQAAWYLDGVNKCSNVQFERFIFIAIETKHPFSVCIYDLGNESIEEGRRQYRKDLNKYKDYLANKDNKEYFTGVSQDIITIQLPTWAFYKNMELV